MSEKTTFNTNDKILIADSEDSGIYKDLKLGRTVQGQNLFENGNFEKNDRGRDYIPAGLNNQETVNNCYVNFSSPTMDFSETKVRTKVDLSDSQSIYQFEYSYGNGDITGIIQDTDYHNFLVAPIFHGTRNLSGNTDTGIDKKVTISFYVKGTKTNPNTYKKIGVRCIQNFGSISDPFDPEPPASDAIINGTYLQLDGTWQYFSHTFTLPNLNSLINPLINGDDYLYFQIADIWGETAASTYGDTVENEYNSLATTISIVHLQINVGELPFNFVPPLLSELNKVNKESYFNYIVNPEFKTSLETNPISDGGLITNRWYSLSDSSDYINWEVDTLDIANDAVQALKGTVDSGSSNFKKFGIVTFIDYETTHKLLNKPISLSFKAKTTYAENVDNIQFAILTWDGTADSYTIDVIDTWGSPGTPIYPSTNWRFASFDRYMYYPTNNNLDDNYYKTFKIENILLNNADHNINNLAILIYTNDEVIVDHGFKISSLNLIQNEIAYPYSARHSYFDSLLTYGNGGEGNVTSVNSRTGAVTLDSSDVSLENVTNDAQVKKISSSVTDNIMTWGGTSGDTPKDSGIPITVIDEYYKNYILNPEITGQHFANSNPDTVDFEFSDAQIICAKWWTLHDVDIVNISNNTDLPSDSSSNSKDIKINETYGTANKKFGIIQYMEYSEIRQLISKKISISFQAKAITTNMNLRCAIIYWSGTKDNVTRDVINSWGTTGNPTLVANWTYINTPADLAITTGSFALHKIENITIPSSNNLAVMIWCNNTNIPAGSGFRITSINMNVGTYSKVYQGCDKSKNDSDVLRYAVHSGNYSSGGISDIIGYASSTTEAYFNYPITKALMKTPSITNFNAGSSPFSVWENGVVSGMPIPCNNAVISNISNYDSFVIFKVTDSSAPFTANKQYIIDRQTDLGLIADC